MATKTLYAIQKELPPLVKDLRGVMYNKTVHIFNMSDSDSSVSDNNCILWTTANLEGLSLVLSTCSKSFVDP